MYAELIKWSELDYQDDNNNLQYGVEIIDENGYSFDCYWFETNEERQKFLIENNILTKN